MHISGIIRSMILQTFLKYFSLKIPQLVCIYGNLIPISGIKKKLAHVYRFLHWLSRRLSGLSNRDSEIIEFLRSSLGVLYFLIHAVS